MIFKRRWILFVGNYITVSKHNTKQMWENSFLCNKEIAQELGDNKYSMKYEAWLKNKQ